jgi:hypothetical protein
MPARVINEADLDYALGVSSLSGASTTLQVSL